MQLGGSYGFGARPDWASAIGVLQAEVAAGVDHIDTAYYYAPGVVNGQGLADLPVAPYGQRYEHGQQAADPCRCCSQRCRGAEEGGRAGGGGGDGDGVDCRERLQPVWEGGDGQEH